MKQLLGIIILVMTCISCEKYEREPAPKEEVVPLSNKARQWFKGIAGVVYFKSNTGLSDSYTIYDGYDDGTISFPGESFMYYYKPNLNEFEFYIGISNRTKREAFICNFSTYIKRHFSYMVFSIEIDSPYRLIQMYQDVEDTPVVSVGGFIPLQDTTIGQTRYTDLFKVNIDNKCMDTAAINNLFISKSKGLVAFTVQKNIIWYRE